MARVPVFIREAVAGMRLTHRERRRGAITLSAGLAAFPRHAARAIDLSRAADQAVYRAKHAGRNRVETAT